MDKSEHPRCVRTSQRQRGDDTAATPISYCHHHDRITHDVHACIASHQGTEGGVAMCALTLKVYIFKLTVNWPSHNNSNAPHDQRYSGGKAAAARGAHLQVFAALELGVDGVTRLLREVSAIRAACLLPQDVGLDANDIIRHIHLHRHSPSALRLRAFSHVGAAESQTVAPGSHDRASSAL